MAFATGFHEYLGSHDNVNPFTGRINGASPSNIYFNPASIVNMPTTLSFGFSYTLLRPVVSLKSRDSAYDVQSSIFESIPASGAVDNTYIRPLPTSRLRTPRGSSSGSVTTGHLHLGAVSSIVKDRVAIGFMALLPLRSFQTQEPFFVDEREQFFSNSLHHEFLGDRIENNSFCFAIGGKVLPWLNLGAGLCMTTTAMSRAELYLPDASKQDESYMNSSVVVESSFVPHFSAEVVQKSLKYTLGVHLPSQSRTQGNSYIQFWNVNETEEPTVQKFNFVYSYEPYRINTGVSYETKAGDFRIRSGLTAVAAFWSNYIDRHGEKPSKEWSDTVTLSAGVRMYNKVHNFGLDAMFAPTPVPDQDGRTNYVDNSRISAGAGYEYNFIMSGRKLTFGVYGVFHYMIPRSVSKNPSAANPVVDEFPDSVNIFTNDPVPDSAGFQTNNPGFPGFSSRGWILSLGASLKMQF